MHKGALHQLEIGLSRQDIQLVLMAKSKHSIDPIYILAWPGRSGTAIVTERGIHVHAIHVESL